MFDKLKQLFSDDTFSGTGHRLGAGPEPKPKKAAAGAPQGKSRISVSQ